MQTLRNITFRISRVARTRLDHAQLDGRVFGLGYPRASYNTYHVTGTSKRQLKRWIFWGALGGAAGFGLVTLRDDIKRGIYSTTTIRQEGVLRLNQERSQCKGAVEFYRRWC